GNEAGANALDLVPAGLDLLALHLLRDHRTRDRLDRDRLEARLALLDHFTDAGDGAAGADAGDENVRLAVGVVPDLLGGGAAAQVNASAMPVLPLVGSMIVVPLLILPSRSAASIMDTPIRSLTDQRGLKFSSLATTVAWLSPAMRRRRTRGVWPIVWVMSS